MFMRRTILTMAVAAACAAPVVASAETYVVMTPPGVTYTPDPVYEPTPAPRDGYVWAPGYWRSDGDRRIWISGHWVPDREYYVVRRDPYVVSRDRDEEHHWWRRHRDGDD